MIRSSRARDTESLTTILAHPGLPSRSLLPFALLTHGPIHRIPSFQVAPGSTEGVVFMFVTDNHGQLQNKFEELESSDNNAITAGVVAILAPSGHGVSRVQLEIQELWLLGYAEYIMTTPGSRIGILGAARTHKAPLVVIDETTVHQSTAPYPCLANYRAVEQTTCFVPSMLLKVPADNAVPCG
mmetsp:Transcript_14886/g.26437  ORF Transcript_14886/g.26437 Transcript_14886/m.26437 type:complete len:184 (-) Transcript_14886:97-648(-)